jgi:hypothetical protein
MDEFVHYHALGCATAPLGKGLPSFRDGCGLYDLRVPLTRIWLPARSYYYIGSFPSLVFVPFWYLVHDPVAARVQGALFLAAAVLLIARLLGVRPVLVLLASLVFPAFALAFVVDEGPVGLSAVLMTLALLALRRSLDAARARGATAWGAAAGLALFAGLWVKLVFVWWLPAAALFMLAEARRRGGSIAMTSRRLRPALLGAGLALLVPTLVLLTSQDVDGRTYGAALSRGRVSFRPADVGAGVGRLAPYLTDASRLAPRSVSLASSPVDRMPLVLAVALLAAGLLGRSPRRVEIAAWGILGAMTFVLAATSAFSQWPHHFVFPALFIVMAMAVALERGGAAVRLVVTALVVLVWASLAMRWPAAVYPRDSSPAKDELLSFVRQRGLDRDTLQVHASWGTYYAAQLFGDPKRIVVFIKGVSDDPRQLEQVACLARERGRRLLLVSSRRWPRLQTDQVTAILGQPEQRWRFGSWWAVVYATDEVEGCGLGGSA